MQRDIKSRTKAKTLVWY